MKRREFLMAGVAAAVSSALPAVDGGDDESIGFASLDDYGKLPFEFGSVDCPVRFIKCG